MSFSPLSAGECTTVGAKARVLYGRLLSDMDYWEILQCDTVPEIADYLQRAEGYREDLSTLIAANAHRAELEDRLRAVPVRRAEAFMSYLSGPRRDFLRAWVERFQAEQLKRVLRWLLSGHGNREEMRARLQEMPLITLPFDALLSSRTFGEALESLKGTAYYAPLKEPLKGLSEGRMNLFPAEMAIDALIIASLYRTTLRLPLLERHYVLELVGGLVDLLNIYWLYRALRFYSMGKEEALNRLLPVRHKARFSFLRSLSHAKDLDEFWSLLKETPYATAFGDSPPQDELVLERSLKRFFFRSALRAFRSGSPSFHTMVAYLMLLEFEVMDLVAIVEDVRYGYDRRIGALFLARPIIPEGVVSWQ